MGSLALCARDMNIALFLAGPGSHANAARAGYFGLLFAALIPGHLEETRFLYKCANVNASCYLSAPLPHHLILSASTWKWSAFLNGGAIVFAAKTNIDSTRLEYCSIQWPSGTK